MPTLVLGVLLASIIGGLVRIAQAYDIPTPLAISILWASYQAIPPFLVSAKILQARRSSLVFALPCSSFCLTCPCLAADSVLRFADPKLAGLVACLLACAAAFLQLWHRCSLPAVAQYLCRLCLLCRRAISLCPVLHT